MIYLNVKEFAECSNMSERHIRRLASNGDIACIVKENKNNQQYYKIPLSELSTAEQLKYYKSHAIAIPEDLLPERKTERPHKEFDEFSAVQREEIAEWIRILNAWDEYCATSKLQKVPATEKFVQLQKVANPDLNISKGILYRKKKALKADDLAGLLDNRGSWKKGTSSIPEEVWQCFLSFYLDEAQHPIQACYEYTEIKSQKDKFAPPPVFERLGIKMTNAIVRNAKAKIIERRFRDVKDRLSRLFPTYTGGNVVERPEKLKKVIKDTDNIPTDYEFTQAVEDILTYYMNEKPYSGAVSSDSGKSRMQVYREQLKEKRVASELDLNLMLMRSTRSQKVGRRGVHLTVAGEKIDYYNDDLILNHFGESVYCRYDPEDISEVRIYDFDDNYIMTAPTDNEAVLAYGASKDAVAQALRKVKSLEKLTKQELKASQITAFGKETALNLVLATAEENKANAEEINPKVISVHRADETVEQLPMAVGQSNIVTIDKAKMIRNLEQRQKEE